MDIETEVRRLETEQSLMEDGVVSTTARLFSELGVSSGDLENVDIVLGTQDGKIVASMHTTVGKSNLHIVNSDSTLQIHIVARDGKRIEFSIQEDVNPTVSDGLEVWEKGSKEWKSICESAKVLLRKE